jgi:hypothetical protein
MEVIEKCGDLATRGNVFHRHVCAMLARPGKKKDSVAWVPTGLPW